jgi:hypothetical protein
MYKGEVVFRQGEVPPSLLTIKVASLCLVIKIVVVHCNGEGFWQAYKVMPPVF